MYSVVGNDGQVYGPVDMATLSQWIAEGRIVETTNLIDPLDGRVIQAGQAPALMGSFPPIVAAPPMPNFGPSRPDYTPGPMNAGPQQPYGYPRPDMMAYAGPPKSKVAAALLLVFFGGLGVHRFYLGHTGTGIAMVGLLFAGLLTCGLTSAAVAVWVVVDLVLILTGGLREANGRALV